MTTLYDLADTLRDQERLHLPDVDLRVQDLRLTTDGTIRAPNVEHDLYMTDWSKSQISQMIGVRWDRWFDAVNPDVRADEVNRRLGKSDRMIRLRTQLDHEGQGILRGIVSTGHKAILDSEVVTALAKSIDGLPARVARANVTDRSTTIVAYLGEDHDAGSIVGRMRSAFMLRNSDVGFASLLGVVQVVRVVCTNGMTAPVANAKIFRKRHVGVTSQCVHDLVKERLDQLPEVFGYGLNALTESTRRPVDDVELEIKSVLKLAHLPMKRADDVQRALRVEPYHTVFGVSQAVTLAAQKWTPEQRVAAERAAGKYVRSAVAS